MLHVDAKKLPSKNIKHVVDCRNDFLSTIYKKIAELKSCNLRIKQHLPQRLAIHCEVSNIDNDAVTLHTKNSSILTQLHHEKSNLLHKLRTEENMHGLKTIHLKLEAPHLRKPNNNFSQSLSNQHPELAEKDSATLAEALQRLEQTLKKR